MANGIPFLVTNGLHEGTSLHFTNYQQTLQDMDRVLVVGVPKCWKVNADKRMAALRSGLEQRKSNAVGRRAGE